MIDRHVVGPALQTHQLTSKDVDRFRGYRCDRRHNSGSLSVAHERTPPLPAAVVRRGLQFRVLHCAGRERTEVAYVYYENEPGRRFGCQVAFQGKLPELLRKGCPDAASASSCQRRLG